MYKHNQGNMHTGGVVVVVVVVVVVGGVGVQEDFYLRNYDVGSCASNCAIMPSNINQRRHHQTITEQSTIAIWTRLVEPM